MSKPTGAAMLYDATGRFRLWCRDLYFGLAQLRRRNADYTQAPLVLCNSYPKSGTHLLAQILLQMPGVKPWNDIIAVQSLSGAMNAPNHIRWKMASAPPRSLVRAHLMCAPEVRQILAERPMKRIFIYRDLRDVAVSFANWVLKEPAYYLHPIYKQLESFDDCLMASICGTPQGSPFGSDASRPDIGTDFQRWQGWLSDPETLAVRFEDLVGDRGGGTEQTRLNAVGEIARLLGVEFSEQEIAARFGSAALDPSKSHTFRKGDRGAIGGWRGKFTEAHKQAFKRVAGDSLIELGYETDLEW